MLQLRGKKSIAMVSTNHIKFKKSPFYSFQFKQTLDSTSTSKVICTIWGHPRSQRMCNGTPTATRTTCFCKSKPDCSFCVSIWHPALKAGDTLMTFSDFSTDKRAARVLLIVTILPKQLHQQLLHSTPWSPPMTKMSWKTFSIECNPKQIPTFISVLF